MTGAASAGSEPTVPRREGARRDAASTATLAVSSSIVTTANDPTRGDRGLGIADQGTVDVELESARRTLAGSQVWLAGRLELEAQLVPSRGYWAVGDDYVLGSSDVVVDVVEPAVLDA